MAARKLLFVLVAGGAARVHAADPFPASTGAGWQWVPITGSKCMDGKETGVYIRYGSTATRHVGIHLNGGGACFNRLTCGTCEKNPHPAAPGSSGIFSTDAKNPLSDFTWIDVPYCTGDVHLGANSVVFKGAQRYFHGNANLKLMLERAVATFPTLDTLFITGESAGGFGAYGNYVLFRSTWSGANGNADMRAILVDDSGPIMDDTAIPACLQEQWRTIWNINASLPAGCPCISDKGNLVSGWNFGREKYPKDSFGLVSSINDGTISSFFSFGLDNCRNPVPIGYNRMEAGLKRLSATGVPIYMIPGSSHTHTSSNEFFTRTVNNTFLYQWVGQLISSGPDPGSVMPTSADVADAAIVV